MLADQNFSWVFCLVWYFWHYFRNSFELKNVSVGFQIYWDTSMKILCLKGYKWLLSQKQRVRNVFFVYRQYEDKIEWKGVSAGLSDHYWVYRFPINQKYSIVPLPSDDFVSITQYEHQTESPLRLKKLWDNFSETGNSISQFVITIIIQSSEISEFILLKR